MSVTHTIRLHQPNALQVSLVGDFNNWHTNDDPLIQVAPDTWERQVELAPGKHRYAFFVIDAVAYEPGDDGRRGGAIRSRIVGNGGLLNVPEDPELAVGVVGHGSLVRVDESSRRVA